MGNNGKHALTIESISANEESNYFEYIPWRSKTSPVWKDNYLAWDSDDQNIPLNLGKGVKKTALFCRGSFRIVVNMIGKQYCL